MATRSEAAPAARIRESGRLRLRGAAAARVDRRDRIRTRLRGQYSPRSCRLAAPAAAPARRDRAAHAVDPRPVSRGRRTRRPRHRRDAGHRAGSVARVLRHGHHSPDRDLGVSRHHDRGTRHDRRVSPLAPVARAAPHSTSRRGQPVRRGGGGSVRRSCGALRPHATHAGHAACSKRFSNSAPVAARHSCAVLGAARGAAARSACRVRARLLAVVLRRGSDLPRARWREGHALLVARVPAYTGRSHHRAGARHAGLVRFDFAGCAAGQPRGHTAVQPAAGATDSRRARAARAVRAAGRNAAAYLRRALRSHLAVTRMARRPALGTRVPQPAAAVADRWTGRRLSDRDRAAAVAAAIAGCCVPSASRVCTRHRAARGRVRGARAGRGPGPGGGHSYAPARSALRHRARVSQRQFGG